MSLSPEAEAAIFGAPAPAEAVSAAPEVKPAPPGADGGKTPEPTPPPPQEAPKGPSLFDAIKAEREAKEARARADSEREGLKKEAEEAKAKLGAIAKAKESLMLDSVGYLTEMGLEPKELMLIGESIMYHLVPDKAPEGHRGRLVEAQMLRDRKAAETRAEAERAASETEAMRKLETEYTEALTSAIPTLADVPESKAWFADDQDAYAKSLFHTARNLAEAANRAGTQADLSPQAVAKALEANLAQRFLRIRGSTPTPAVAPTPKAEPAPTKQTAPTPDSTPNANPRALTEKERLARAAQVVFGN